MFPCQDLFQRTVLNRWLQRRFKTGDLAAQVEKVSSQLFAFTAIQQMPLDLARLSLRQFTIDQRRDFFSEIATHNSGPLV
jgi:hypothetical protein